MPRSDRRGAKPLDLQPLRDALMDDRVHVGLGKVVKRDGESTHFEIADGDVLVEVDLVSDAGQPLTCRLGGMAGGAGTGLWRIPPVGTEVVVLIPMGELERADPVIVGTLASGTAPAGLDETTLVVLNPGKVRIHATAGDVEVEASGDVAVDAAGDVVVQGGTLKGAAHSDAADATGDFSDWAANVRAEIQAGGGGDPGPAPLTIATINVTAPRRFKV